MNKLKVLPFLITVLFAVALLGCKKDDPKPSRLELLTSSQWTGHKLYLYGQDISLDYKIGQNWDISKNIMNYDESGTFTDSYNGVTTVSGTWELTENDQKILHNRGTSRELTMKIKTLTSKQLIVVHEFIQKDRLFVVGYEYIR